MIFIRMQDANDRGDVEDLRQFSTPEMFAAFRVGGNGCAMRVRSLYDLAMDGSRSWAIAGIQQLSSK